MLLPLLTLVHTLHFPPADTLPQLTAQVEASAYLDSDARHMVRQARQRREAVEGSITGYRVLARERISVGLQAMRRDRVLFRRETAVRVHWSRGGTGRIEVLGARQAVPIAMPRASVPDDLRQDAPDLAFDPGKDLTLQGFGEDDFFRHPLAPGSEVDYRFQAGDTMALRLSPERVLRLVELKVIPRRADARLLQGAFLLDVETHAPVRATFKLARLIDLERDLGEDEDIPAVLKPIRGEVRYVTVDYGLWEQRWWLPRLIAVDVIAQSGSLLNIPVTFERSYTDYSVEEASESAFVSSPLVPDTLRTEEQKRRTGESCNRGTCWRYLVDIPADTAALLASELLPSSIYAEGESLITESELRELADVLGVSPRQGEAWRRPEVRWSYLTPDLLRFNRVEGLAVGGRADADAGPLSADAELWIATADPQLSGEIGVTRGGFAARHRVAAYRRLSAVDPDPRALSLGSSLAALLLGRDDSDYFRALGVELAGEGLDARGPDYRWRLFAERHSAVGKHTDLSLPSIWDRDREFAPNIAAQEAEQIGIAATLRLARGLDPLGFRWGAEAGLSAETGTYRLLRPSLSTYASFPLPFKLVGALELAGGSGFGEVPLQRRFFLGGPATVRGFGSGSRIHGDTFWRSRAEVASAFPGARLVLFSDAGWAGQRAELEARPSLLSAGVGASFLDGLLRLDLARALRGAGGWRLDFHLDAPI